MQNGRPFRAKAPNIRNISEIRGPIRKTTLIHFTAEQWKRAIRGIPVGRRLPKEGVTFEAYPIPDGGVIGEPNCIAQPCQICVSRQPIGPRGEISFECLCRPDPKCPPTNGGGGGPATQPCRLVLRRVGGFPQFVCDGSCTGTRQCRLTIVRERVRIVITCACR
jgi:hypothetical protein